MTNKELFAHYNFLVTKGLECRGKIGYGVARNIRRFEESLTEYFREHDRLVTELGENGFIKADSPNIPAFIERMRDFDEIENNPEVFKITEKDLQESDLPADIMLGLSFMTKEGES